MKAPAGGREQSYNLVHFILAGLDCYHRAQNLTRGHRSGVFMSALGDWKIPQGTQPRPQDYGYDLDTPLASVVGLRAIIPPDGFTAETLGTERAGNGVLIGDGVVLTIGYLIT